MHFTLLIVGALESIDIVQYVINMINAICGLSCAGSNTIFKCKIDFVYETKSICQWFYLEGAQNNPFTQRFRFCFSVCFPKDNVNRLKFIHEINMNELKYILMYFVLLSKPVGLTTSQLIAHLLHQWSKKPAHRVARNIHTQHVLKCCILFLVDGMVKRKTTMS